MEDKITLENKIFEQNNWVSVYKTCRVNNTIFNSGEFVVFSSKETNNSVLHRNEISSTDNRNKPSGECFCIRGFVSEANQVYVLLQDVISNEELMLKQIANAHLLDTSSSRFFFGNTLDSLLLKDFCKNYKKISKNPSVSNKLYVDLEKKCIAHGSTFACLDTLRAHALTNHNISFYHTVYKRCTAHVIGLINDDVDNGPILFIRYFYRYDEPEVENADREHKILDKALKGKQYFKRIPRLWSNHFAVVRVPKWNVENIKYCIPKKLKPTNVCCILTFLFPQRKILELPSYLLQLQELIPAKPDIPSPPNKNEPTYLDDIMDSDDEGDEATVSPLRHKRKTSTNDLSYEEEQRSLHGYKLRKRSSSNSSDDEEIINSGTGSRAGSIIMSNGGNSIDGFDEDNASIISSSSGTNLNDVMDTVSVTSSGCASPNLKSSPPPQLHYNPAFYTPFILPAIAPAPPSPFHQSSNNHRTQYNVPVNNDMVMLNSIGANGNFFSHKSNGALVSVSTTTTTTTSSGATHHSSRTVHNHHHHHLSDKEKSEYVATKLESLIKALIFYAPSEIVDDISSIRACRYCNIDNQTNNPIMTL